MSGTREGFTGSSVTTLEVTDADAPTVVAAIAQEKQNLSV